MLEYNRCYESYPENCTPYKIVTILDVRIDGHVVDRKKRETIYSNSTRGFDRVSGRETRQIYFIWRDRGGTRRGYDSWEHGSGTYEWLAILMRFLQSQR